MATAAVASWLHLRKEYAAAAPLWKEIAAKTDHDSADWMRSEWHLGLAVALDKTGDPVGAKKALEAGLPERLMHNQRKLHSELNERLGQADR